MQVRGNALDLRDLINVVESSVQWWQRGLSSGDAVTRDQAARAIDELSQIMRSLSQQLAQGRTTICITRRLPALRTFDVACPSCGSGNRAHARFCQRCGALLNAAPRYGVGSVRSRALKFRIAARTDTGRVRQQNQDAVYAGEIDLPGRQKAYLCLVADGMGGAAAGEYASRLAADVSRTYLERESVSHPPLTDEAWQNLLRDAVRAANRQIYDTARVDATRRGMGTTLTIALLVGDRLHIASVGDSRAYLLNLNGVTDDGALSAQLTSDHSLVARLVDIGQLTPEQARTHPQRNILYRSIGTDPSVDVDTRSEALEPGDIVLLCSDGLVNHVNDEEIVQIAFDEPDPDRAVTRMVNLANERGGRDNISVVMVRVEGGRNEEREHG
ncbi:MAG: Stp1/IreP family PP2C-type Ser/Thr phosphatase [Roseiflexus sp.]|nr:Stp1/IreP family PP2C-type Ser/Thr phosphatase [Roseiflexus sp.]MCS7290168.1 Stp1/IreP family PP2C-type Ser/Thr phosphatase [Roseiflexus sp.]MDW8232609.1 Stp1/IreP family PP2C-type Ser/Thr phosphatase [Roseiflexaceae bacterium]